LSFILDYEVEQRSTKIERLKFRAIRVIRGAFKNATDNTDCTDLEGRWGEQADQAQPVGPIVFSQFMNRGLSECNDNKHMDPHGRVTDTNDLLCGNGDPGGLKPTRTKKQ
jgi:hypothetical protein